MKKILVLLLVIVTVVLSVPVSAASASLSDIIHDEIIHLIDIKQYGADPSDEEIYLISVMESGYTEKGFTDQTALYVYLYNPSRKKITSSELNAISMATEYNEDGKPVNFKKYRLQVEGSADGELYIRAKVAASAKTLAHVKDGVRWYGITEIELHEHGSFDAASMKVGYVYKFSGYDKTLFCSRSSFLTLTLKPHQISYLLGQSKIDEQFDYYNQLNSVYFSVPSSIEGLYGSLYSIEYEYYQAYTNPILITNSEYLYSRIDSYVTKGTSISDLFLCERLIMDPNRFNTFNMYYPIGNAKDYNYPIIYKGTGKICDIGATVEPVDNFIKPTVIFKVADISYNEVLVPADAVQSAFENYSKLYGENSGLYRGYSKDLFDFTDEDSLPKYVRKEITRDDLFDVEGVPENRKWWQVLFGTNDSGIVESGISYIQPIKLSDVTSEDFSETFYVDESDVAELKDYCLSESLLGNNVYVLRYALSDDYRVTDLIFDEGDDVHLDMSETIYAVQEKAYLDFDMIKLTFGDDVENLTVFGVVSSPTDGFAGIVIPEPNKDVDWLAVLKKIIAVVFIGLLAFLFVWVVGLFGQLGEASTNRQILRELKRRKRK